MASRGINKVILIGYLGQDPDVRYMPNGNAVSNLNLATSDVWKDKNTGESREKTEWHRIVLFGKLAEISGKYLKKGSQIYIEGSLQTRKWKDQNGIDRYTTEIIVSITGTMKMLGSRNFNNSINTESSLNNINSDTISNKKNLNSKIIPSSDSDLNQKKSDLVDMTAKIDFDDDDIPF